MKGLLVYYCDRHWKGNQSMGLMFFACFLTNKEKDTYSELLKTIFHRIGVKSNRFEIRISSQLKTENGRCTLSIMNDADVTCLLTYKQSDWHEINVKVVEISVPEKAITNVFQTPIKSRKTTINLACTLSALKPTSNPQSSVATPHFKSVSGSNQPFRSIPSPRITSIEKDHRTPASTNKHADVDDTDSSETSYTEDESGSELYSIQPVRSKDLFEDQGDQGSQGPIYKEQIFKDKQTLKGALGLYALQERFEYKVKRSNHTRFAATCRKRDCEWVITAGKLKYGTYRYVKSLVKEHTCGDSHNYNVDFKRVSSHVIGELFSGKNFDPGCTIRPKDIIFEMKDLYGINLSYNKAYRLKDRALHKAFGDPWESFKKLPTFFYMLEQSNLGTVTKFETDSQNRFTYGFMALSASIEGFNTVITPIISIDATHLKAKTRGVLLVAMCKDGNEMIYPLAFGFAN
ncbi:hypothetical protein Dsin_001612 [Dipteronia sinensis]|uniref:Transposase MuDR plant domain-containing protein n=1 Tax=Dipteronia sinensis TaxID=43782 RepID=A0AAE0EIM1_9ROSI|nr:hypothetical protein Dsin_001612 [Dipteronia sinensis]